MALAGSSCTAMPAAAKTPSEKADVLLSGLIQANEPGFAVLVAQDGKILFEKGYGLADREHGVPVTPQTIFRIASVTKQFTASAILKLQEEGKLSVDDKLSKYIPDFPHGDEVTLRQLLTMSGGFRNVPTTDPASHYMQLHYGSDVEAIAAAAPVAYPPGQDWAFDNDNLHGIGLVVERATGLAYAEDVSRRLWQPLGARQDAYVTVDAAGSARTGGGTGSLSSS